MKQGQNLKWSPVQVILAALLIGLLVLTGCQTTTTESQKAATSSVSPDKTSIQKNDALIYARPYTVVSEGKLANKDPGRSTGLWFITSEEASGFEEYAQTAIQAVLDLYRLNGRDYTSVLLIPNDRLEYAGLTYAQASFAADGKGSSGMTGDAPAKEGYWVVRAADRRLNEQELAIAETWNAKQQDFPSKNPLSSLSYDQEALRQYIAGALNTPYDEIQMPVLEISEYGLYPAILQKFSNRLASTTAGKSESAFGKWQTLPGAKQVLDLLVIDNEVWATTSGGVIKWNLSDKGYQKYTMQSGLASNRTQKITRDSQGNIWVTFYNNGVSRFDGKRWDNFSVKNGLCSDDVITLAADNKGGVWVSAYWGVSYFDGKQWASYSNVDPEGLVTGGENPMKECRNLSRVDGELGAVDEIFVDSRGDVWFSSRGRGLTRYDNHEWKLFTTDDGLGKGGINAIFEDKNGTVWFDGSSGITGFDGEKFSFQAIPDYHSVIPRPTGQDIMQDNQGNLWLAAYGGGVVRFDGKNWRCFTIQDGLPGINAQDLFLTPDGYPGVIIDQGVSWFDGGSWQDMTTQDGLPGGKVRLAINDAKGNLWFGGEKGVSYYLK